MTLKSGMHGPYARQADTGMAGSEFGSTTGQALPDRSALGYVNLYRGMLLPSY